MEERVVWECKPRTRAKLAILDAYLSAWFNILAVSGIKHVIYIDAFCGPGAYTGGEKGSPVVAAERASEAATQFPGFKPTLFFIDQDRDALEHLAGLPPIANPHPNVSITIFNGEFLGELDKILSYLKRHPNSPTFSFVDPFGFGQSPYEKLKLLMHNRSSELFINFMCGFMNRFKTHRDDDVRQKIMDMIGTADLDAITSASDPIDKMCALFEQNLRRLGRHTSRFAMRDEGNIRDNAFFFCGNNALGLKKIKEAMWVVDPIHGSEFSAHRQAKIVPGQVSLFDPEPYTAPLSHLIRKKFAGLKYVAVKDIFRWVVEETPTYLERHARMELEHMYGRGEITVHDPGAKTIKRQKFKWPERLMLTFSVASATS